jgi:hypothetical protein
MQQINFPDIKNPKEYFLKHDGLSNLGYDLDFSIFRKYRCFANCRMCYIKNDWIEKEKFNNFIPKNPPNVHELDILKGIFSYFEVVSIIDDLRFIKDQHPQFFKFYQEHQNLFYLSSMTDNAVFRHKDILLNEFKPIGIHEISFSEEFISKSSIEKLLLSLDAIHHRTHIKKLKLILTTTAIPTDHMSELLFWAKSNAVEIQKTLEFDHKIEEKVDSLNKDLTGYSDVRMTESTVYSEDFGDIYPVLNEVIFLMNDVFYCELKSATSDTRNQPFAYRDNFHPLKFLVAVLKGKIADYKMYCERIKNTQGRYHRYFKYVSDNLIINEEFNFIPNIILRPFSKYYKGLIEKGFAIDSKFGLLTNDYMKNKIVPLIDFHEAPEKFGELRP